MSKLTISSLTSDYRSKQGLNANFTAIEDAFDNTLSRDGTGPNQMVAPLDVNGNQILNLPSPVDPLDPIRLVDIPFLINGSIPVPTQGAFVLLSITTDADATLTPTSQLTVVKDSSVLTAGRGLTLSNTNALSGWIVIVRRKTDVSGFDRTIFQTDGTTSINAVVNNQAAVYVYTGTTWNYLGSWTMNFDVSQNSVSTLSVDQNESVTPVIAKTTIFDQATLTADRKITVGHTMPKDGWTVLITRGASAFNRTVYQADGTTLLYTLAGGNWAELTSIGSAWFVSRSGVRLV